MITSSTMAETRSTAILNETIASLKSTTDCHNKDIQEIHKITNIHTRTLNEMSQQLATILQKLNAAESVTFQKVVTVTNLFQVCEGQ